MLEINAIYLVLLAEGFGLLLLALCLVFLLGLFRKRRKSRAVGLLVTRIRDRAEARLKATESFLRAVFNLEGEALRDALESIDRQETEFYQQLIDSLYRGSSTQISSLDAALNKLIEAYKCLKPSVLEAPEIDPVERQLETTLSENERLREELSITKNTMSQMILEFGEMFGGGQDHGMALDEVLAKIMANHPDVETDEVKVEKIQK